MRTMARFAKAYALIVALASLNGCAETDKVTVGGGGAAGGGRGKAAGVVRNPQTEPGRPAASAENRPGPVSGVLEGLGETLAASVAALNGAGETVDATLASSLLLVGDTVQTAGAVAEPVSGALLTEGVDGIPVIGSALPTLAKSVDDLLAVGLEDSAILYVAGDVLLLPACSSGGLSGTEPESLAGTVLFVGDGHIHLAANGGPVPAAVAAGSAASRPADLAHGLTEAVTGVADNLIAGVIDGGLVGEVTATAAGVVTNLAGSAALAGGLTQQVAGV